MKKVLITGANGYIGGYLRKSLKDSYDVIATDVHGEDYLLCDLVDRDSVYSLLKKILPDIIIHCAGTRDLVGCEKDPGNAHKINVETTKNIVDAIDGKNIKFIFLSSDYVFSGMRGWYREDDIPDPKTVYGKNKLECEKYIKGLQDYTICRTASVYGEGNKFFGFIFNSLKKGERIDVYNDSYFSPTYIGNLAEIINAVIEKDIHGVLHTAGRDRINRYAFAVKIAEFFNLDTSLIRPAIKPKDNPIADDSSLDVVASMDKIGIKFLGIEEGLKGICIS